MTKKQAAIPVVHFCKAGGGGVFTVIKNLLQFRQHERIENHVIFTVNKKDKKKFTAPRIEGAATVQSFPFSPGDNFYHTCKKLAALLPSDNAILVAHDWLELGMISHLGLQHPVVFMLHGDYDFYYHLAIKHDASVDAFICVAEAIADRLKQRMPHRSADVFYKNFPVPHGINAQKEETSGIVFLGRLAKDKGYDLLPVIAGKLDERKIQADWHVIGPGRKSDSWPARVNVQHYGELEESEIRKIIATKHIMILPSLKEGMPVSLAEGMMEGMVPVSNDLPGGIQELVQNGRTGYKIPGNSVDEFVLTIEKLIADKKLLQQLGSNAKEHAEKMFGPEQRTAEQEQVFLLSLNSRKKKIAYKVYGSMLDKKWIPNWVVKPARSIIKQTDKSKRTK